jgi:importin subunit alpha-1
MIQGVMSNNIDMQLAAVCKFRKILSKGLMFMPLFLERNPPIAEVISCGVIPKFVEFLARTESHQLQV